MRATSLRLGPRLGLRPRWGWYLLMAAALLLAGGSTRPGPASPGPGPAGAFPGPVGAFPGPYGLALERDRVDLGRLALGTSAEVEVGWRREGAGPLRILAVQTGCGCVSAEGLAGELPEGATGRLRVRLARRQDLGPFRVAVRIHAQAPSPRDVVTLRISGYVGDLPVVRPDGLDLAARTPGSSVTRRLEVATPPGFDPLAVTASLEGLSGDVLVVAPGMAGRAGRDLLVTCEVPVAAGPFEGRLLVRVGAHPLIPVPIRGLVVPPPSPEGRMAAAR